MNRRGTRSNLVASHPGNSNAVRSGVYSPRTLAPRAREIAEALMAAPHTVPLDVIAAEEIGSLVALLEAIDSDLLQRGLVDREGEARSMLDHRARVSRQLERWLGEFGATPASRASWAETVARGETLFAAMQKELERGRKLREKADRRRIADESDQDG
jgi:hypothetical protein